MQRFPTEDEQELYESILENKGHWFETSLVIGETGVLSTRRGEHILFGGDSILVASGAANAGYSDDMLVGISTKTYLLSSEELQAGCCVSGQIHVEMLNPSGDIPRAARLAVYVRATDGERTSGWIPQGVYYVDTRSATNNDDGISVITLDGFDSMMKFETDYPSDTSHSYPLLDTDMVQFMSDSAGVSVDPRTFDVMTDGYEFSLPIGYSMREVLSMIGSAYAGNWVMTETDQLRLVLINDMPRETNLLMDHMGNTLVFGEDRIYV